MSTPPAAPVLAAQWFDGRSSRARPAQVALRAGPDGTHLLLQALDGEREQHRFSHAQVGWPERWSAGKAPPRVVVDLGTQGSLQIDDVAGWQRALAQVSHRSTLAERMQTRWRVLLAVLALAAVGLWAFYRWGTPWAAAQISRHVPLTWELALTEQALPQIDAHYLKPTQLPAARQAELRAGFDRLAATIGPELRRYPGYHPQLRLEFRAGMPPNAFALPGGLVVMTDEMVHAAATLPDTGEAALLGVLAHEIGHVQLRHTTRLIVEQGVLNAGLGLALGDVSTLVSMGASLLTGLHYQRRHEIESDCYAVALLAKAQLPTAPMANLLDALDRRFKPSSEKRTGESSSREGSGAWDWLSTHPDTAGRTERLRSGQGCEPI